MREVCPKDVTAMVQRDSKRQLLEQWVEADSSRDCLKPVPLIEPLQRWFRGKPWNIGTATAAQAVTSGLWTQE
eukprot:6976954-Karenia_brevis.AAC.1